MEARDPYAQITLLLKQAHAGNAGALDDLLPLVYDKLRGLAASYLGSARPSHTLQPTALVHEAYVKIAGSSERDWFGRHHFYSVAAKAMRQILVNYARDKRAQKRGPDALRITLDSAGDAAAEKEPPPAVDIPALEDAMAELDQVYPQQCRIVELKFFAGLTNEEVAEVLGLSLRMVEREWRMAKAWLLRRLEETGAASGRQSSTHASARYSSPRRKPPEPSATGCSMSCAPGTPR